MKKYILEKNGKDIEVNATERVDELKKLSKEIREKILEKPDNLFPEEIDTLIKLLEIELKYIMS